MYLCIVGGVCLLLVFHVHIHRPLPHELRWGSEESTMYLLPRLNSRYREMEVSISSTFVTLVLLKEVALILLSNLETRFCLRGVGCDAPGFQLELLTLMSRSAVLTLVKWRSTCAITSKTSPTNPNDPFGQPWSTFIQTLVQNPLNTLGPTSVAQNFCRVLQISPKHFKISQCKVVYFVEGHNFHVEWHLRFEA
jgi:hypothetical protein